MITVKRIAKGQPGIWVLIESNELINESRMRELQFWCVRHKCGKRMAFDMFRFKTESELSMFMLKWCQ